MSAPLEGIPRELLHHYAREIAHESVECWAYFGEGGRHSEACENLTRRIETRFGDLFKDRIA